MRKVDQSLLFVIELAFLFNEITLMTALEQWIKTIQDLSTVAPLRKTWWRTVLQKVTLKRIEKGMAMAGTLSPFLLLFSLPLLLSFLTTVTSLSVLTSSILIIVSVVPLLLCSVFLASFFSENIYASDQQKDKLKNVLAQLKLFGHNIDYPALEQCLENPYVTDFHLKKVYHLYWQLDRDTLFPTNTEQTVQPHVFSEPLVSIQEFRVLYDYLPEFVQHKPRGSFLRKTIVHKLDFFTEVIDEKELDKLLTHMHLVKQLYPQVSDCIEQYEQRMRSTEYAVTVLNYFTLYGLIQDILSVHCVNIAKQATTHNCIVECETDEQHTEKNLTQKWLKI